MYFIEDAFDVADGQSKNMFSQLIITITELIALDF